MKGRDWAILVVIILNLIATAYWGGTTRERVDQQGEQMQYFMRQAGDQHVEFQTAISANTLRISVAEALHEDE